MKNIDNNTLLQALTLLEHRLSLGKSPPLELVVCGGSALIATELVSRTTKDLDIIALFDSNSNLIDPSPLPSHLISAAKVVARNLNLTENWLNTGPDDLFRMGLPDGFKERLICHEIGQCLKVHFISRLDQIYFKLYASVDRGGYHIDDLMALKPTEDELILAGKWSRTHDVSEGYAKILKDLLKNLGVTYAASRV
jgi:hypothetical protein